MSIRPILLSLRKSKTGAFLIALQIAVTLAIGSNALFIVKTKIDEMRRPTGVDETNLFTIYNQWITEDNLTARVQSDLASVRSTLGVLDAYATGGFPLGGAGSSISVQLSPDRAPAVAAAALYAADSHTLHTLGLRLIGGRWFQQDDLVTPAEDGTNRASPIIVTKALAQILFSGRSALGKTIYLGDGRPVTIVGVVERAQGPWINGPFVDNAIFEPRLFVAPGYFYVIRAQPGHLDAAMKAVTTALIQVDRQRVFGYVATFQESRAQAYRGQRSITVILTCVSVLMLAATALGIAGLSSHWVTQRRRQIGVRRALGARRRDIVGYFLTENLLISGAAALIGSVATVAANLWLVNHFEMPRMQVSVVLCSAIAVIMIGLLSALTPALRAAAVPPALAARGA